MSHLMFIWRCVKVLWGVTPYSLLGGHQPFGAKRGLRLRGRNGGGGRNLRTLNTVIIFRNPEQSTSYFPLWIPLFVCFFTVCFAILCPVSFSCYSLSCRVVIQGEDSSAWSLRWSSRSTVSAWMTIIEAYRCLPGDRGGTVVKVLCYKSEGRWFDSRWCHWNFSLI